MATHPALKNSGVVYMNCELNALGSVSTKYFTHPSTMFHTPPGRSTTLSLSLCVVGYVLKVPFSGAFNAFSAEATCSHTQILKYKREQEKRKRVLACKRDFSLCRGRDGKLNTWGRYRERRDWKNSADCTVCFFSISNQKTIFQFSNKRFLFC